MFRDEWIRHDESTLDWLLREDAQSAEIRGAMEKLISVNGVPMSPLVVQALDMLRAREVVS